MPDVPPRSHHTSLQHLLGRLAVVEARAERAERALADGGDPALLTSGFQRLLGVVDAATSPPLDEPGTAATLARVEELADAAERDGLPLRLRTLARRFGLDELDVELLLAALAPEVESRVALRYRRLTGDTGHAAGRATVGLALTLCHLPGAAGPARSRLDDAAPLVASGLVRVLPRDLPWLERPLEVPRRVVAHLLGEDPVDARVAPLVIDLPPCPGPAATTLATGLAAGARLAYLRAPTGSVGAGAAVAAAHELGAAPVTIDLDRLPVDGQRPATLAAAAREARLRGTVLVIDGVVAGDPPDPGPVRALTELPGRVILAGAATWDPAWADHAPLLVVAEPATAADRARWWSAALADDAGRSADLHLGAISASFALDPRQVRRAAEAARLTALAAQRPVTAADLQLGARAQNGAGLERLARRITPTATFDDLVLADDALAQLRHLVARWQHRATVLDGWGMARGGGRGRGVTAMLAGESGTGKTLSAEIVAGALGLELYVVELSTVVDKYVGETAKNLERIFAEADHVNGVLLFDEADALFGKRSGVSDAQDRYANVEVAYLLQRFEAFDGIAVLTTNLAGNLDEAFLRRLDVIIDLPRPDVAQRRRLWEVKLPVELPRADDLDLDEIAARFTLSGAEIESTALSAAYTCAETGRPLTTAGLVRAIVTERRKLGRQLTAAELGPFAALGTTTPVPP